MKFKKILVLILILSLSFALINTVNAGLFDFLEPKEVSEPNPVLEEFRSAYGAFNLSDENNSVKVIESAPYESTVHWTDLNKTVTVNGEERKIGIPNEERTNSTCTMNISLNVDLSKVSWYELWPYELSDNNSLLGTPTEKHVSGNLSALLNDALSNNSDIHIGEFYLMYTPKDAKYDFDPSAHEDYNRKLDLNPQDITVKDGKMCYGGQIKDYSTECDLSQLNGVDSSIYLSFGTSHNHINLRFDIPITEV